MDAVSFLNKFASVNWERVLIAAVLVIGVALVVLMFLRMLWAMVL